MCYVHGPCITGTSPPGGREHVCCATPAVQGDPSERVGRSCGCFPAEAGDPSVRANHVSVVQPLQCRATHPSGWVVVVVAPLQMQGDPSGPIGPPCTLFTMHPVCELLHLRLSYCLFWITKLRAVYVWVSSTSGCFGVAQGLLYRHDHVDVKLYG